eukprot:9157388-Prorocentrum_lima.AAC.1
MTSSLVGSEMCIRDRFVNRAAEVDEQVWVLGEVATCTIDANWEDSLCVCLLYTSDAADDM